MNYTIIVKAFIRDKQSGKILLLKKKGPSRENRWETPGGHVEDGENVTDAIKREIREETSLLGFNIICPFNVYNSVDKRGNNILGLNFLVEIENGVDVCIRYDSNEHSSHRWFEPEEIIDFEENEKLKKGAFAYIEALNALKALLSDGSDGRKD